MMNAAHRPPFSALPRHRVSRRRLPRTGQALALACALVAGLAAWPVGAQAASLNITINFDDELSVQGSGPRVEGSGVVSDQARSVGSFTKLRLEGPMSVKATQGSGPSARVRTDDNLQSLVITEVVGDTLVIRLKPNASFRTKKGIEVQVGFNALDAAEVKGSGDLAIERIQGPAFAATVSGSGDLDIASAQVAKLKVSVAGSGDASVKGVQAQEVDLAVAGSGDLHASGSTQSVAISLSGSGDVEAHGLKSRSASASIAGSGDVSVHASDALTASIAGSGDIRYEGSPKVTQRIAGSGEVSKR